MVEGRVRELLARWDRSVELMRERGYPASARELQSRADELRKALR